MERILGENGGDKNGTIDKNKNINSSKGGNSGDDWSKSNTGLSKPAFSQWIEFLKKLKR